jgi:hypothetical protein
VYSGDGFGKATPLAGAGEFHIGQVPDSSTGDFDLEKSFGGNLSQLNVWNEILTADQINSTSKSCFNEVGNLFDWSTVVEKKHGAVYKESPNPCKALRQSKYDFTCRLNEMGGGVLPPPSLAQRMVCEMLIIMNDQGRREGGMGKLPRAPTLIGPQLESESLKLSRFFKLVGEFLKLIRAPYSS